jgi:hypothetical protein
MDNKLKVIEDKIEELNKLINEFKLENQLLNNKQKRKIYNKNYYSKKINLMKNNNE